MEVAIPVVDWWVQQQTVDDAGLVGTGQRLNHVVKRVHVQYRMSSSIIFS